MSPRQVLALRYDPIIEVIIIVVVVIVVVVVDVGRHLPWDLPLEGLQRHGRAREVLLKVEEVGGVHERRGVIFLLLILLRLEARPLTGGLRLRALWPATPL